MQRKTTSLDEYSIIVFLILEKINFAKVGGAGAVGMNLAFFPFLIKIR